MAKIPAIHLKFECPECSAIFHASIPVEPAHKRHPKPRVSKWDITQSPHKPSTEGKSDGFDIAEDQSVTNQVANGE